MTYIDPLPYSDFLQISSFVKLGPHLLEITTLLFGDISDRQDYLNLVVLYGNSDGYLLSDPHHHHHPLPTHTLFI